MILDQELRSEQHFIFVRTVKGVNTVWKTLGATSYINAMVK